MLQCKNCDKFVKLYEESKEPFMWCNFTMERLYTEKVSCQMK
jgi:hypothetical protein